MHVTLGWLRAVPENNVQGGETALTFRRDWVVGVRGKILHWVVGKNPALGGGVDKKVGESA